MPPKFQSSFIPKGPVSSMMAAPQGRPVARSKNFFATLAVLVFTLSAISAGLVFLYNAYLNYHIGNMSAELDSARATLDPGTITELTRLNSRLVSTKELLSKHTILSPLLTFLETSTIGSVRFSNFSYVLDEAGPTLTISGEANGYMSLALQADILSKSPYLKNVAFSDLTLDQQGNVLFSMTAILDQSLVSYDKLVEATNPKALVAPMAPTATSTVATTTSKTATTTRP